MKIGARFGRGGIHFLVRVTADRPLGRASIGFFHPGGYCIIFKLSTLCMHRSYYREKRIVYLAIVEIFSTLFNTAGRKQGRERLRTFFLVPFYSLLKHCKAA